MRQDTAANEITTTKISLPTHHPPLQGRKAGGVGAVEAYNTALVIMGGFFVLFCPYWVCLR